MDARDALRTLLDALGQRSRLGALDFDAAGVCALRVGQSVVHLFAEPGADAALFYVPLGPVPDGAYRSMLEANLTDAAGALALDARSGEAMLVARPLLAGLALPQFERLVSGLAAAADRWRAELSGTAAPTDETTAAAMPTFDRDAFASSMIRG